MKIFPKRESLSETEDYLTIYDELNTIVAQSQPQPPQSIISLEYQ